MVKLERVESDERTIRAIVREKDGTLTGYRWNLADILDRASIVVTSNVAA
jgi:hypothetical protein